MHYVSPLAHHVACLVHHVACIMYHPSCILYALYRTLHASSGISYHGLTFPITFQHPLGFIYHPLYTIQQSFYIMKHPLCLICTFSIPHVWLFLTLTFPYFPTGVCCCCCRLDCDAAENGICCYGLDCDAPKYDICCCGLNVMLREILQLLVLRTCPEHDVSAVAVGENHSRREGEQGETARH